MAKFRLKTAHVMRHTQYETEVVLNGDKENADAGLGEEKGTLVGDGTPYKVISATIEMEPLDDEAKAMIAAEERRLENTGGSMNPLELLARQVSPASHDDYEQRAIPGFPGRARPQTTARGR